MVCVCVFMHCRGFGYVEYETHEMAQTAVERMNNVSFRGSNLQVTWVSAIIIVTLGICFSFEALAFWSWQSASRPSSRFSVSGSFGLASRWTWWAKCRWSRAPDGGYTWRRYYGTVLREIWRILACPERILRLGTSGNKNQRSNWLSQIGVRPLFRRAAIPNVTVRVRVSSVRVIVRISVSDNIWNGGPSEWRPFRMPGRNPGIDVENWRYNDVGVVGHEENQLAWKKCLSNLNRFLCLPDRLMFYPWCFFFLKAAKSPRSLGRSPRNFATWLESW